MFDMMWTEPWWGRIYIAKFENVEIPTVAMIRELSQTCEPNLASISLVFGAGQFGVDGVIHDHIVEGGHSDIVQGVRVIVRGPGQVEYREGTFSASYSRGKMQNRRNVFRNSRVNQLMTEIQANAKEAVERDLQEYVPDGIAEAWLSSMLAAIERSGHGGTIAFLPENHSLAKIDIRRKSTEWGLPHFVNQIATRASLRERFGQDPLSFGGWQNFDRELVNNLKRFGTACAQLANCDGATVITRGGNLMGFDDDRAQANHRLRPANF